MCTNLLKKWGAVLVLAPALVFTLSSCQADRVEDLENENIRLKSEILVSDSIQIQFMNAYAEIEYNLNEIKIREKVISEAAQGDEKNPAVQQRILQDINDIGRMMSQNRKRITTLENYRNQLVTAKKRNTRLMAENEDLRKQLTSRPTLETEIPTATHTTDTFELNRLQQENNQLRKQLTEKPMTQIVEVPAGTDPNLIAENQRLTDLSNSLNQMIENLKKQVLESESRIENLQEELSMMKEAYAALEIVADSLRKQNTEYRAQLDKVGGELKQADEVFYTVKNVPTLKSMNLLAKTGLSTELNESYFTKAELNEVNIIETNSGHALLLSSHPVSSYEIDKSERKNWKYVIKNKPMFWKNTRFCVIAIK